MNTRTDHRGRLASHAPLPAIYSVLIRLLPFPPSVSFRLTAAENVDHRFMGGEEEEGSSEEEEEEEISAEEQGTGPNQGVRASLKSLKFTFLNLRP